MVDTGASITIIKASCVPSKTIVDGKILRLNGVNGTISNRGCAQFDMVIGEFKFRHRMCVIESIECNVDGILGINFFKEKRAQIDFCDDCIRMENGGSIPMYCINAVSFIVPERCEKVFEIEVNQSCDLVVQPREVAKGVFSAGTIVRPIKGKIQVKLMNINEKAVEIKNFKPELISLDQYECMNFEDISDVNDVQRVEQVLNSVKLNHLNSEERLSIQKIIAKYNDIFHLPKDKLSVTNLFTQSMSLRPNVSPSYVKPYRLPFVQKEEIKKQIGQMIKDDIIEPAVSEWSSPLLLVPKKSDHLGNKKWRLVIDYRLVNQIIQDDKFPLPNITEILDSLAGAVYFSHLDLSQGFYQLELSKESRGITAFTTPDGQFQMKRLPMGLKISPNAFSRMMTVAMSGLNFLRCFVYLDDLIVFGKNLFDHNKNLHMVLSKLRSVNLKLNVDKCQFLKKSILYLGHTISEKGIQPDESKLEVIKLYPVPKNFEEVKRFVAMVNYYRRHIDMFAEIARPLNALSRKGVAFLWTKECEAAFQNLKSMVASPIILDFPNFDENNVFQLTTDASGKAIGGVLSNQNKRPIAFASRALNKAELNYSTIEKELLAVVWGVKHFRPYLFGRKFVIYTDHRPLVHLFSMTNPSSRLIKFRLFLEEYNFEVLYIKGSENVVADALSRIDIEGLKMINKESVNYLNAVTRSATKRSGNNDFKSGETITAPKIVELIKAPKNKYWLLLEQNHKFNVGITCHEDEIGDEKLIYVNLPRAQHDLVSIVKEVNTFLKAKGVNEVVLLKNSLSIEFVKKFVNLFGDSETRLVIISDKNTIIDP